MNIFRKNSSRQDRIRYLLCGVALSFLTACGGSSNNGNSGGPSSTDTTPNTFQFIDQTEVELATVTESNVISVGGITASSPISISGGEYSIAGGTFTTANGMINNGQSVVVRQTSSEDYSTTTDAVLTIGGVSDTFSITTIPDTVPDAFSFIDRMNVGLNENAFSVPIKVSGIEAPAEISIVGGQYSINEGPLTSEVGTIANGQSVYVSQISSENYSTTTNTILTIGGVSGTFSITTMEDSVPDAFSFIDRADVGLNEDVASTSIRVSGIEAAAEISIVGGRYSINEGPLTSEVGTVTNGQLVFVRQISSSNHSTTTDTTLTIGGVSDTFSVTTVNDSTPDAFSFIDQTDVLINQEIFSAPIIVSGIDTAVEISIDDGDYSINGGPFTQQDGMVTEGQSVVVRLTSPNRHSSRASAELSIGDLTDEFDVITMPYLSFNNFQAADVVIGQEDFDSRLDDRAPAANTLKGPNGSPVVVNGMLFTPDSENNRILAFNELPIANNAFADFVLGQPDFSSVDSGLSDSNFELIGSLSADRNKLFAADVVNSRVLIWNTLPSTSNTPADIVLGQPDFNSNDVRCTQTGLSSDDIAALWAVNGKLIVADSNNNRVLIWNTIPSSNHAPADIVLGQQDFTHCTRNDTNNDGVSDGPSEKTLFAPSGVWSDGQRLVVVDGGNNRILIWETFPSSNFAAADLVLGQSDFNHNTANDDDQDGLEDSNPSARTLNNPFSGIYSNGTQLFVSDSSNHRVLVWSYFPTSNFEPANVVLGQGDFSHNEANDEDQDGVSDNWSSSNTLRFPGGIYQSGGRLIVSDSGNDRQLLFTHLK